MNSLTVLNNTWMLGYCNDDPVRPHLSIMFRTSKGREVWALEDYETGVINAIVCVAYTTWFLQLNRNLKILVNSDGKIALILLSELCAPCWQDID